LCRGKAFYDNRTIRFDYDALMTELEVRIKFIKFSNLANIHWKAKKA